MGKMRPHRRGEWPRYASLEENGNIAEEVMTESVGAISLRTYERDGLTLGYSVVGDGPPILFIHGATATGEFEWGRLATRLASDYRCVLPDLRGHGRSEFRGSDDMGEAIRADLRHLLKQLGLDQPAHCGLFLRRGDLAHARAVSAWHRAISGAGQPGHRPPQRLPGSAP